MNKKVKKYLPELIYGGIDGSITTFAIVAGVAGASLSSSIILVIGVASLIADGFSMGVSNYFSQKSENSLMDHAFKNSLKTAWTTFISFIFIGVVPLIPYLLDLIYKNNSGKLFFYSSIMTLIALFGVGYTKGFITKESKIKSGFEVLIIGAIAALIAYGIGHLLQQLTN